MDENQGERQPFKCYFCNCLVENDTPESHMAVCIHVLEPCPYKCGSYVQRNIKHQHLKICPNGIKRSMPRLSENNYEEPEKLTKNTNISTLDLGPVRNSYEPDQTPAYRNMQMELSRVCGRLQILEQSLRQMDGYTTASRRCQDEVFFIKGSLGEFKRALEKVRYQIEVLFEWKKHVETLMDNLHLQRVSLDKMKEENDNVLHSRFMILEKMGMDLSALSRALESDRKFNREIHSELRTNLEDFREHYGQENIAVASLWNDQKDDLSKLRKDLRTVSKIVEELKLKMNTVIYDLKLVNQTSSEASQKTEILEREFSKLNAEVQQIKCDLKNVEESNSGAPAAIKTNGRLLWKITEFEAKMGQAKENEVVLKSPIFYTHEYGYKIRILVYLNGLKKWKGRNLLAGIHVLKGEYDLMQKWPCSLEANIIIHDLQDRINPKSISKKVIAKRSEGDEENEEPDESSSQYIFVPHTTLLQGNYTKEDTMFIEAKVIPKVNFESTAL